MKFRSKEYPRARITAGAKSLKFKDHEAETSDKDLIAAADSTPGIERAESSKSSKSDKKAADSE